MNPEQKPTETPLQSTPAPFLAPVPAPMDEVTAALPPSTPSLPPSPTPPKKYTKLLASLGGIIAVIALAVGAGMWFGGGPNEPQDQPRASSVTLPKEATVTAECVAGRGKQYILPKDIPIGPIYDVHQGKVIAVEYLAGQKELSEQSEMFANLALPQAEFDHLAIVPTEPHAGLDETHFHVIGYMIPASEVKKITCDNSSTSTDTMSEDQMH